MEELNFLILYSDNQIGIFEGFHEIHVPLPNWLTEVGKEMDSNDLQAI